MCSSTKNIIPKMSNTVLGTTMWGVSYTSTCICCNTSIIISVSKEKMHASVLQFKFVKLFVKLWLHFPLPVCCDENQTASYWHNDARVQSMTSSTDCPLTRSNLLTRLVAAAMAGIGAPNWNMSLNRSFSYKHIILSDSLQPLQIK